MPAHRTMRRFASILAAAALLGGCADPFHPGYPYSTLEVSVTTPDGAPVPDVPVEAYDVNQTLGSGSTGADGVVRFGLVPAGDVGVSFRVPARLLPAVGRPFGDGRFYLDGIAVGKGEVRRVEVALRPRACCGVLRVRVADRQGRPLGRVRVDVSGDDSVSAADSTAATGAAAFSLAEGVYALHATLPAGYLPPPGSPGIDLAGLRLAPGRDTTVSLVFTNECCGRVRARVTEASGAPVAGARVILYGAAGVIETATTDAAGEHLFTAAPVGNLAIRAEPPAGYHVPAGRPDYVDGIAIDLGVEKTALVVLERG
ncbi:MAG: hypothetical protein JWM27_903 [Gemmatimonadetes bacterium]|nr:hypothetical protein [Gemmatimonadota bacterium]